MATRDEGTSTLEADIMSVTLDDQEIEDPAPVEGEAEATPQDTPAAPADSEVAETEQPDAQAEAEPEAVPPPWQPPEGGSPLSLRADGREFPVEGALKYDHGVYIPNESWPQLQRFLADREAFNQRVQALQRQVEERDPEKHPDVLQARATVQSFLALMDQGPEKVAEWLDKYEQNRPLFELQIQKQALEAQLQARNGQFSEVQHEQAAQELAQQIPGYLKQNIDAAISQLPELKELAGLTEQMFERLWPMADYLLVEATKDMPELGLSKGQIGVHPERLKQVLKQQADARAEIKRLEKAAQVNKTATAKPVAPVITSRGPATPGARSTTIKPGDRQSFIDAVFADEE